MSSPFNEEKYRQLLEGLEISEVRLSDVLNGVETFRLDAEYHSKEYERIENYIKNNPEIFSKFSNWNVGIDCSAFYPGVEPLYGTGNIPLIRVQNVKEEIEYDNCVTLPTLSSDYSTLKFVNPGDIVITKGGSIGFVGYITKRAYASRDLMFINSSQLEERERIFLYLYLSTDFSFKQLIRSSSQCAQPHLTITLVKNFDIFLPSNHLKDKCYALYKEYSEKQSKSKLLYAYAEGILLAELGLKGWVPDNNPVNVKQLGESYLASGRLDAEYYQSKYDEIENVIIKYKNGYDLIRNRFSQNVEVCDFKGSEYNYIEIGNINIGDGTAIYNLISKDELPDNAKRVLHKNDILISKVRPYRGAVSIIDFDDNNLIGSGAFTVLHEKSSYKKEVLQILLRTQIYKDWLLKWNVGSSYPVIKDEDILNLPIPLIPDSLQTKLAEYVQKSISLRNEAKRLLEEAKMMVEREIEKGGKL